MTIPNGAEIFIDGLSPNGKGISRVNGMVIMTDNALPGQTVSIKIKKKKKRCLEAKAIEVIRRSEHERDTPFQDIPGAPWIHLLPEKQKEYKRAQIKEWFAKFSSIDISSVFHDYIESPRMHEYRNKMEYSFGYTNEVYMDDVKKYHRSGFGLGSRQKGSFLLVENLCEPSGIFDADFERLIPKIRQFCLNTELPPYDTKLHRGFFRYLKVRKSFYENAFLVTLYTHSDYSPLFNDDLFYELLSIDLHGRLKGYRRKNHNAVSDAGMDRAEVVYEKGDAFILEKINNLLFQISEQSFFQTNPACAEKLYRVVVDYCKGIDDGEILDLYCGTGTMSRILQEAFPKNRVIGVEWVAKAISDAIKNARADSRPPTFHSGNVKNFLNDYRRSEKSLTVIVNPPRAGVDPKPLKAIIKLRPEQIVYVSCNPATLAANADTLVQNGYALTQFTAVDQFPHTPHIECVAKFEMNLNPSPIDET